MIVFGTRPEIIKMASVIEACEKFKVDYFLVHTNQHFDENMSQILMRKLRIPIPEYFFHVGSDMHGLARGSGGWIGESRGYEC
jgi:UDP-N-acetylglucosamine 2-epimerase (non-hydrolysing)